MGTKDERPRESANFVRTGPNWRSYPNSTASWPSSW